MADVNEQNTSETQINLRRILLHNLRLSAVSLIPQPYRTRPPGGVFDECACFHTKQYSLSLAVYLSVFSICSYTCS